jgi:alcohol dehydrogenase class IV
MPEFNIKISPRLIFGSHELSRIGGLALEYGKRALLITGKDYRAKTAELEKLLAGQGIESLIYYDTKEGYSSLTVADAVSMGRKGRVDLVIGFGGSRICSLAKAVAVLIPAKNTVEDFYNEDMILKVSHPLILIPATARDPFLFSDICPVTESRSRRLHFCATPESSVAAVLMDPALLIDIPKRQMLFFLLEGAFFAVENYLIARSSFFTDVQCYSALVRFSSALEEMEKNPQNPNVRQWLCEGQILSAFSQSLIGLTPGLILTLATANYFDVPRSSVAAILAPYFLESALYPTTDKMETAASTFKSTGEGRAGLADRFRRYLGFFDLPARLSDLGLRMDRLYAASDIAGDIAADNMPGVNKEEFFNILKEAY